jgi:hypothetical protein
LSFKKVLVSGGLNLDRIHVALRVLSVGENAWQ